MFIFSITLLGIGLWRITFEANYSVAEKSNVTAETFDVNQSRLHRRVMSQKDEIYTLKEKIIEVQKLVAHGDDETSLKIRQLFYDIDVAVSDYKISSSDAPLIAKWIDYKSDDWIASLRRADYPDLKKAKNGDFQIFKNEIAQLINLLKENILEGVNNHPDSLGMKRHIDYPFLYRKALLSIQELIYDELDKKGGLNSRQQDELIDCMNQLVEYIR